MNKIFPSAAEALKGVVKDGQLMAVGGFGLCGIPEALIDALRDSFELSLTGLMRTLEEGTPPPDGSTDPGGARVQHGAARRV